jgi:hypothetical protein
MAGLQERLFISTIFETYGPHEIATVSPRLMLISIVEGALQSILWVTLPPDPQKFVLTGLVKIEYILLSVYYWVGIVGIFCCI